MQRSRLKNIINKSKTLSNKKEVGDPFDKFKKSLPIEIDDNYRLEAAWKAYGSPKDYKAALWEGMIQPIDENNYKLPSIGYNEETDEYEYLNKGEDNETVAKDIRVWDNDVIPFVQELKLGGYVRTFNKEKDCWIYSKNKPQEDSKVIENNSVEEVNQNVEFLKQGGKPKRNIEQLITYANNQKPPFIQRILNNDERSIPLIMEDGKKHHGTHLLTYGERDGKTYVFPEIQDFDGDLIRLNWPANLDTAIERGDFLEMDPEEAELFTKEYKKFYPNYKPFKMENGGELSYFKQGGQMTTIPSGSLHARKNGMELAEKGEITSKGIPVIDNDGNQQAEIERNEVIFNHSTTTKLEELYKKFSNTDKESEKDDIAIKAGKILTNELINNTQDNTGLIQEVAEKNNLEYDK